MDPEYAGRLGLNIEELLIAQMVLTHTRVLNLTALASKQTSLEAIRIINEYPWSNMFVYNMFLRPTDEELEKLKEQIKMVIQTSIPQTLKLYLSRS